MAIGRGTLKLYNVKDLDGYFKHMVKTHRSGSLKTGADYMFGKASPQQKFDFLISIIDSDREMFVYFLKLMK